jgi:hypothetical protein
MDKRLNNSDFWFVDSNFSLPKKNHFSLTFRPPQAPVTRLEARYEFFYEILWFSLFYYVFRFGRHRNCFLHRRKEWWCSLFDKVNSCGWLNFSNQFNRLPIYTI